MRIAICAAAVVAAGCVAVACAADISVPEGFSASATGWSFMGGFDYLPNGDIIGMYTDPNMTENSWIGVADANGDGIPASVEKVYDFGMAKWGGFVKVSPGGTTALFCESTNYKLYTMDLDNNYSVQEIIPDGGTFDGAFDLAFAGETSCYVSANPGWSKTNEILHLDIVTGKVKKVASIPDTYSGPVDSDDEGNLYYVSGKAHYPVEKGDFTLLKFDAAKLAEALEDGLVLARGDATVVAMGLDGGCDVAWHASSGDLFVSDCNHGTIVRIPAGGVPAEFASLPGEDGEGFTVVAFFDGGKAFARGERSSCTLAADYLPMLGNQGLDVYCISPPPPFVNTVVSSKRPAAGSRLALTVTAQPHGTRFDGYIVLLGPGGDAYSVTGRGLVPGVAPYVSAVRGLSTVFKDRVLDMSVPPGAAEGKWKIYAGLMRAGAKPDTGAALALDEVEVEVVGK